MLSGKAQRFARLLAQREKGWAVLLEQSLKVLGITVATHAVVRQRSGVVGRPGLRREGRWSLAADQQGRDPVPMH